MKDVKDGRFSLKVFYLFFIPTRDSFFPSRMIWNPWVPTKVSLFAWETSWGKVLTLDQCSPCTLSNLQLWTTITSSSELRFGCS